MTPIDIETILIKKVKDAFGAAIIDTVVFKGEITHTVERSALLDVCNFLKTDADIKMNYCVDVVGVDNMHASPRFEVNYHLYSIPKKHRLRLKVKVGEGESVLSVTGLWAGADWPEREVYDMFGIPFEGHPNLKRIYMPEDWDGYPLRKDYPLRGYKDSLNPNGVEKEE